MKINYSSTWAGKESSLHRGEMYGFFFFEYLAEAAARERPRIPDGFIMVSVTLTTITDRQQDGPRTVLIGQCLCVSALVAMLRDIFSSLCLI